MVTILILSVDSNNRIDVVMASMFAPSALDLGFEPMSGQTQDYNL
jgi:phage terminase large subunit-like protein